MTTLTKNIHLAPRVCSIQYIPCAMVASLTRGSSNFARKVNFMPGKTWLDLYHTPGSATFDQPSEKTPSGTIYNQKLEIFFPGLDTANLADLFNMDYTEFILKIKWSTGDSYLIGSKEIPVIFSENWSSSKGGSIFTFFRKSIEKAHKYEI